MEIRCNGCLKKPDDLEEYQPGTEEDVEAGNAQWAEGEYESPADYVAREEGTFNRENGHFVCTPCYITMGSPSSPKGWMAP